MVLEQETLRDKAMKLYACKLTEGHVRIPSLERRLVMDHFRLKRDGP